MQERGCWHCLERTAGHCVLRAVVGTRAGDQGMESAVTLISAVTDDKLAAYANRLATMTEGGKR